LQSSLMAWVGGDDVGREAIQHLTDERVGTEAMVIEQDKATSYWYVLRYGADRTMLVKSEKFRYEWKQPATPPDWIYLSYIGIDSWPLHEALLEYLEENPDIKLAFQPGTFHFKWGVEKLSRLYRRSNLVVMNREEAVDVTSLPYDDLRALANGLHDLGPETVVITDGAKGSYASYNGKLVTIPNYPDPADPLDRTGAGDAFASTIMSALATGESMETALLWAPINSMNVVQKLGAQAGLLSKDKILDFLEHAPEDYAVTEL
jgi:sugar/nucleoside kinase (ribokinase family)